MMQLNFIALLFALLTILAAYVALAIALVLMRWCRQGGQ
jgi:hypothetical protein